jgi:hypothetical protein
MYFATTKHPMLPDTNNKHRIRKQPDTLPGEVFVCVQTMENLAGDHAPEISAWNMSLEINYNDFVHPRS